MAWFTWRRVAAAFLRANIMYYINICLCTRTWFHFEIKIFMRTRFMNALAWKCCMEMEASIEFHYELWYILHSKLINSNISEINMSPRYYFRSFMALYSVWRAAIQCLSSLWTFVIWRVHSFYSMKGYQNIKIAIFKPVVFQRVKIMFKRSVLRYIKD